MPLLVARLAGGDYRNISAISRNATRETEARIFTGKQILLPILHESFLGQISRERFRGFEHFRSDESCDFCLQSIDQLLSTISIHSDFLRDL